MKVENPILRGFHPDPSVIRVGEDYYIANSTFEWWPGIRIHRSRDLVNWELMPYPLNRVSQLDLKGVGASWGVWAPDLSYDGKKYYLIYTVVKSFYCNMYDTANFVVTADSMYGPWSEPAPLRNFGFDPSLFHDTDGKKYMICMVTDHRVPKKYKGRLLLQEYDSEANRLIGDAKEVYQAENIYLEGPHIYRKGEYYYLSAADTGTGEGHGQTVLRSEQIWGPYEMYLPPKGECGSSILTSRHQPSWPLQKAGHGDLVEGVDGSWYMFHLCGRPLEARNSETASKFPGYRRYMLGRETAIQKVVWTEDGWPVLDGDNTLPQMEVSVPDVPRMDLKSLGEYDDFEDPELSLEYQSLRIPMDETFCSLSARPGYVRLYGREGLASKFEQSLIARRLTEFEMKADTQVEFEPLSFKQMAGLICFYDTENYHYLHITHDEDMGKCVSILTAENKQYSYPAGFCPIRERTPVRLTAEIRNGQLQFGYALGDEPWQSLGPVLDASILSDEACREGWFTGAMVGICCQDLTGDRLWADFDYLSLTSYL